VCSQALAKADIYERTLGERMNPIRRPDAVIPRSADADVADIDASKQAGE